MGLAVAEALSNAKTKPNQTIQKTSLRMQKCSKFPFIKFYVNIGLDMFIASMFTGVQEDKISLTHYIYTWRIYLTPIYDIMSFK